MLKAVIIDASAISRDLLSTILLAESYQVVGHSHSGTHGLALAIKHKPHIVCVDMQIVYESADFMPRMREQLPKTLVFMMSSELKADTLKDALARGVHGVIIKPFNSVKVINTIKTAVLAFVKRQQAAAQAKQPDAPPPAGDAQGAQ